MNADDTDSSDNADAAWAAWASRAPVAEAVNAELAAEPDTTIQPSAGRGGRRRRLPSPPQPRARVVPVDATAGFRRGLVSLITVLTLVCALFVVLSQTQGPKLDQTQVDPVAVTQNPGQQARLFVQGEVAHISRSQVTLRPLAPFTVQTIGNVIAVQFTNRLAYSTTYGLTIHGVTSVNESRASTLTTRFTTAAASVLALVRSPGADDEIVSAALTSPGRRVVYRAPNIQAFGEVNDDLVVVTEVHGLSTISLVDPPTGTTEELLLPSPGRIMRFAVDPPTGTVVFGFLAADSKPAAAVPLLTIPLSGNHLAVPLLGPDRQPVVATAWFLQQGSPVVVAQVSNKDVEQVDLSLGGTQTRLVDPAPLVLQQLADTRATALPNGSTASLARGALVVRSPSGPSRMLYHPAEGHQITQLGASPNGQFLTAVTTPTTSPSDGYTINPQPVAATSVIIDTSSGAVTATITGTDLQW